MPREILLATDDHGKSVRYVLDVFQEAQHWASILSKCDDSGNPQAEAVAPRFYGLTQEQARRRMISILENQYEQVETVSKTESV